ncbi:AI-2E family transporter [Niveispirillum sp. KHB5.9]|uniref:AI-2E family transporter n=1 Tax=Niveispirillum sp. KHB5.9 TaxID=3400269 RepID=UPI003A86D3BF
MMRASSQWKFWVWGLVIFVLLFWLLRSMLAPFVVGMAVAYLLDPVADKLEARGWKRWSATTLVLLGFLLAVVLALLLLAPLLQAQITRLIEVAPEWITWAKQEVVPTVQRWLRRLPASEQQQIRAAAGNYAGTAVGWTADVVRNILTSSVAIIDILSVVFITPIVAFYLLRDWDRLVATVDGWLPRPHVDTIREQAREVDTTLAGFVRGQALVCLFLGVFYALGLTIAGLEFGLVIGLITGILSFIPFVGSLVGFSASVGLALFQFDEMWRVGVIMGIFFLGQAIEGNFLTPKLVGDRVGLHPVWVIFALMAGGALAGFVGVLVAVPVASIIGVLTRFCLRQYTQSSFYNGCPPVVATDLDLPPDPLLSHPAAEGAERAGPADTNPAP